MADGKIRVSFEPKGDKELIDAIKSLNRETKKLRSVNVLTEKSVDKVTKAKGRQRRNSDALDKSLFGLGGTLSVLRSKFLLYAFAIQQATTFIGNHIRRMSDLNAMEDSFNNLAVASQLNADTLERLQDATDGTVNKMDLLKQANNALLLGVFKSTEQMEEAFDAAQRLGKALGQDTAMSIESLVTGLGRQSKLMLDNLGIVFSVEKAYKRYAFEIGKTVEGLSDQERKTAFVNTALKEMNKLVSDLPDEVLNWSDAMKILSASTFDFVSDTAPKSISALIEWLRIIENKLPNALKRGSSQMHETFEAVREESEKSLAQQQESLERFSFAAVTKYKMQEDSAKDLNKAVSELFDEYEQEIPLEIMPEDIFKSAKDKLIEFKLLLVDVQPQILDLRTEAERVAEEGIFEVYAPTESQLDRLLRLKDNLDLVKKSTEDYGSSTARAMGLALGSFANLAEAMGEKFENVAALQKLAAIANMYASASGAIAPPPVGYGATPMGFGMATAAVANGIANVIQINNALKQMKAEKFETGGMVGGRRHSQGGTMIEAERGEFVMSRNAVSAIGVENLNRMNQGQSGGGGSINISINGGMISPDFVENELAESIREAVRRGADFGIS